MPTGGMYLIHIWGWEGPRGHAWITKKTWEELTEGAIVASGNTVRGEDVVPEVFATIYPDKELLLGRYKVDTDYWVTFNTRGAPGCARPWYVNITRTIVRTTWRSRWKSKVNESYGPFWNAGAAEAWCRLRGVRGHQLSRRPHMRIFPVHEMHQGERR